MKNFVTLFPDARNIHLIKDVGMIPYTINKNNKAFAKLVCYKNGEYEYLDKDLKGFKISFIKKVFNNRILDSLLYLLKNRNIDILNVFHLNRYSIIIILFYKLINNRVQIYLKLDLDERVKNIDFKKRSLKNYLRKKTISKCSLVSIETKDLREYLSKELEFEIKYIPNGFYKYEEALPTKYDSKSNIICTVGRIGTYQKATEILLDGFRLAENQLSGWKLKVIGPIQESFKEYLDEYFKKYPNLKHKIEFTGAILDRKELKEEYDKAKIFCLTSRFESFGIVLVEALYSGCFILSTNLPSSKEIINENIYGQLFEINNYTELSHKLIEICNDETKMREVQKKAYYYALNNYGWDSILEKICENLKI